MYLILCCGAGHCCFLKEKKKSSLSSGSLPTADEFSTVLPKPEDPVSRGQDVIHFMSSHSLTEAPQFEHGTVHAGKPISL